MAPSRLNKIIKKTFLLISILPGLIILYLLSSFLLAYIPVNSNFKEPSEGIDIFVQSNGVHTDIVLPVHTKYIDWTESISPKIFPYNAQNAKYISFGWGDKGFYLNTPTWDDLKFSTAFKALFWLSSSAVHTTYFNHTPIENKNTCKIKISPEQYLKLIKHVQSAFEKNTLGIYEPINCCHYNGLNDMFYEGKGVYNLFTTCNSWTNEGLKKAGIRTAIWSPFEWSVMKHVKEIKEN